MHFDYAQYKQKGQTLIFLLIGMLVLAGGAFYLGRQTTPKPSATPTVTSQTPQPTQVPTTSDISPIPTGTKETANWTALKFTDKGGFSYELKIPPTWVNGPWGGGHTNQRIKKGGVYQFED